MSDQELFKFTLQLSTKCPFTRLMSKGGDGGKHMRTIKVNCKFEMALQCSITGQIGAVW